ncbi:MAG TPA: cation:proton antiporter, partial [Polyangiaceae bacterium]
MLGAFPLLILQICVIIVAARLIGGLARRLGQPAVIAEVMAGILLGPSLLGRVSPGVFQGLFPKASLPTLSLLSQVGLVFFMFLIGLELDPKLLRGRGKSSFAISAAGICVPFGLGALVALQIFGTQSEAGVPRISFVLFMGIAMSITAFPVLARILAERNLIRTKLGSIALACAAADDVTAWCLLALVVSVVHAKGAGAALVTTFEALAFAGTRLLLV